MTQSWGLELIADITAGWRGLKTMEVCVHLAHRLIKTNASLKRWETHQLFGGVSHAPTLKQKVKQRQMTRENSCLFVSWSSWKSHIQVIRQCLTLCFRLERTLLNIQWSSHLLKQAFIVFIYGLAESLCTSVVFSCFQPAVMSAMSSSSQDCAIHHNNAVEHHIRS